MTDVNVYYCWACDAHCRVAAAPDGQVHCPHCQRELTADAKLPIRVIHAHAAETSRKIAWPAPVRPRLAVG